MTYEGYHPENGSSYATVSYGSGDFGKNLDIHWCGMDRVKRWTTEYPSDWEYSTWYHNVLEYDPVAETAHLVVTKRDGGAVIVDLLAEGLGGDARLEPDVRRLGMTNIGDWQVAGAMGNYEIDNITFVPEPATLSLLLFGGLVALKRRR